MSFHDFGTLGIEFLHLGIRSVSVICDFEGLYGLIYLVPKLLESVG